MEKIDFRQGAVELYKPGSKHVSLVAVPAFDFLMIDGQGDPNTSPDYAAAVQALYALSYGAKFASKLEFGLDYTVLPLEGLWFGDSPEVFLSGAKDRWSWTMMIRQPVALPAELWASIREKAAASKGGAVPAVRLESFAEGLSVQIMYVGAYDAEGPTILRLHDWIADNGYVENGHHHEIYLGDPRRTAPERLKTVLRQPVRSVVPISGNPVPTV